MLGSGSESDSENDQNPIINTLLQTENVSVEYIFCWKQMTQPRETNEGIAMDATDDKVNWAETFQAEQKSESRQKMLSGSSR
jgi:hypothetical protein